MSETMTPEGEFHSKHEPSEWNIILTDCRRSLKRCEGRGIRSGSGNLVPGTVEYNLRVIPVQFEIPQTGHFESSECGNPAF